MRKQVAGGSARGVVCVQSAVLRLPRLLVFGVLLICVCVFSYKEMGVIMRVSFVSHRNNADTGGLTVKQYFSI